MAGQEEFFHLPSWWCLKLAERGWLLVHSIDLLKEFGFLNYFLQLGESKRQDTLGEMLREDVVKSKAPDLQFKENVSVGVPLDDSLTSEALLLFLYGTSAAAVAFLVEVIAKRLMNVFGRDSIIDCSY